MVAAATRRIHHLDRLRRLRDVGGIPERALHVWAVSLAILLARDLRRSEDRLVRREAGVVAWATPVLAGADHPPVSRAVSFYVLLLSRRVLQSILGGSDELRSRR